MKLTRRGLLGGALSLPLLQTLVQAQSGGVLRYGLSGYPQNFQPWINAGAAQGAIKLMTQRGLLSYDRAGRLQGELADSWSVDNTGAWTFRLREKAFFHNGAPVTASDVIWSLQQVAAPSLSSLMQPQLATVERFEAPDALTVRLLMKAPSATVPNWLAVREMPIIPKDSSRENPIGAGPFRIIAQERGTSIDLAPFDRYYKPGMPKLTRIKVVAYPDDNLRLAAFQAGDVDIIDFVPVQSMGEHREIGERFALLGIWRPADPSVQCYERAARRCSRAAGDRLRYPPQGDRGRSLLRPRQTHRRPADLRRHLCPRCFACERLGLRSREVEGAAQGRRISKRIQHRHFGDVGPRF